MCIEGVNAIGSKLSLVDRIWPMPFCSNGLPESLSDLEMLKYIVGSMYRGVGLCRRFRRKRVSMRCEIQARLLTVS